MGRAKEYAMAELRQGFASRNAYVCTNCVEDDALRAHIAVEGEDNSDERCTYCEVEQQGKRVLTFNDFIRILLEDIATEWSDVNNEALSWNEGRWSARTWEAYNLFDSELEIGFRSERLLDDVRQSLIDRAWCRKNPYELSPHQALMAGWQEFTNVIKHEARYVFFRRSDERAQWRGAEEIPPSEFLDALADVIGQCELYSTFAAGKQLCRLRVHKPDEKFDKASDLGSPPVQYARTSNRMSAAGISAFYGAFDQETTIRETASDIAEPAAATLGTFRALRDLRLVDLTKVPSRPSIFDSELRHLRPGIRFLHGFLNDFTAPVVKDGREHIDYVPTQVVAEYLRFIHRDQEGRPIDGILYNSAQHEGAQACVLFFGPEGACDPGEETAGTVLVLESAVTFELKPVKPKDAA